LKKEIVLVMPILPDEDDSMKVVHVTFVCKENILLTLHYRSLRDSDDFEESIREPESWLPGRSISALLSAIMISTSLECLAHVARIRESINTLEEYMESSPGEVEANQILGLRKEVISLAAIVGDQMPTVEALNKTSKPFFKLDDGAEYGICALANLKAADGSLNKLDGRVRALRLGFEMNAQDQTNRRLNLLTILSAVFNPATLLAGIWGMNFASMPELSLPYAYPIGLGIMATIGVMMYLFFRRDGWFD
jgi:magnesium transporter